MEETTAFLSFCLISAHFLSPKMSLFSGGLHFASRMAARTRDWHYLEICEVRNTQDPLPGGKKKRVEKKVGGGVGISNQGSLFIVLEGSRMDRNASECPWVNIDSNAAVEFSYFFVIFIYKQN